jgi:transcriptional regulator with GAF, ATPase, and Fis domain
MAADDEIDLAGLAIQSSRATEQLARPNAGERVARFSLTAADGPAKGASARSTGARMSIGSHASNDLVIDDRAVSRFHCEVALDAAGAWVVDLDSRNGTVMDGVRIGKAALRNGSLIQLGRSTCRFDLEEEHNRLPISDEREFGGLVGASVAMRTCFALLERAAASEVTVLLEGETGTGKEGAAHAIHGASRRAEGPFLVVDCGAVPANLLESELFGHERGAFTGAGARRVGVFEEAAQGTVFLDEIGELPLELQPKLLRVLEQRQIRPLGASRYHPVDVRIIAATNRDLRALVNDDRFRPDLYYRLAVLRVTLPPLRQRPDDVPELARRFLEQFGADAPTCEALLSPDSLARIAAAPWPGNVRELRNYLERCAVMRMPLPPGEARRDSELGFDPTLPYAQAKQRVTDAFERLYLTALLARHAGNVSRAARAAGMDRVHVHKLLKRHGLKATR